MRFLLGPLFKENQKEPTKNQNQTKCINKQNFIKFHCQKISDKHKQTDPQVARFIFPMTKICSGIFLSLFMFTEEQ